MRRKLRQRMERIDPAMLAFPVVVLIWKTGQIRKTMSRGR